MIARPYAQTALAFNLEHIRPHHDFQTEFHTANGPFTLVPLPGRRSSLVFVVDPVSARSPDLADAGLGTEIERRSHSILGKMELEPGRGLFPLALETARHFGARGSRLLARRRTSSADRRAGPQPWPARCRTIAESLLRPTERLRRGREDSSSVMIIFVGQMRSWAVSGGQLLNRSLLSDFCRFNSGAAGLGFSCSTASAPFGAPRYAKALCRRLRSRA